MNDKASQLNLNNTHFVTPHGLDNEEHYTTAYEMAVLTDYALNNEKFAEIVKTKICSICINGSLRNISNTNELLGNMYGVDGVKTGFTGTAMRCLVTSCTRDENQIITVVFGSDTKKQRTQDSIKLIEFAFSNFERINIEKIVKEEFEKWENINKKRIHINKCKDDNIELELSNIKNTIIPVNKDLVNDLKTDINCIYSLDAPLNKGKKIGSIILKQGDEIYEEVDILIKKDINKKNIFNYILELLKNYQLYTNF